MSLSVRPANLADCSELSDLVDEAGSELSLMRGGAALLSAQDRSRSIADVVATATDEDSEMVWSGFWDGVLVGYATARATSGEHPIVSLTAIYTTPDARQVGVGEALLEAAIAWAEALGASAIDSQALPGARESKNLFERFGLTARLIVVRRDLHQS